MLDGVTVRVLPGTLGSLDSIPGKRQLHGSFFVHCTARKGSGVLVQKLNVQRCPVDSNIVARVWGEGRHVNVKVTNFWLKAFDLGLQGKPAIRKCNKNIE